jgi:hypothetical protein
LGHILCVYVYILINKVSLHFSQAYVSIRYSWAHYCMSEHVVLTVLLYSWQYCHRQSVVKISVLML